MFNLALELPGNGAYRLPGSPREYRWAVGPHAGRAVAWRDLLDTWMRVGHGLWLMDGLGARCGTARGLTR